MRTVVCFLALACGVGEARADTRADDFEKAAEKMTYGDVFKVAVRTAPQLERAGFDVTHGEAGVLSASAIEDWTLTATGDYQRNRGGANQFIGDSLGGDVSLARLLPTNGTLSLIAGTGYFKPATGDPMNDIATYSASLKLRLTQPLLRDVGSSAEKRTIRRAAYTRDAALLRVRANAQAFAATLSEAYWRLSLAWRVLAVRRAGLDLANEQKRNTAALIRTGKLAASEQLSIDASVAGREQDILTAELDVIERSLDLRRLAGLEVNPTKPAIKPEDLPAISGAELEIAGYVKVALENSPDLAIAKTAVRSADELVESSKRADLPRLDLLAEGGPLGVSDPMDPKVGDAFTNLTKAKDYAVRLNLTYQANLGERLGKGTQLDDRATRAGAKYDAIDISNAITANIARAIYEVRTQQKAAGFAKQTVDLAVQNVEAEKRKFDLGKSTNNEIVRLQEAIELAKLNEVQAIGGYIIAKSRLDAQAGVMLDKLGIKIDERGYGRER